MLHMNNLLVAPLKGTLMQSLIVLRVCSKELGQDFVGALLIWVFVGHLRVAFTTFSALVHFRTHSGPSFEYDIDCNPYVKISKLFLALNCNNSHIRKIQRCRVCSKEPSRRDGSFEHPQHRFWLRIKEIDI